MTKRQIELFTKSLRDNMRKYERPTAEELRKYIKDIKHM